MKKRAMTKTEELMQFLAEKRVPQDVLKDAVRDSKHVKKADIMKYAREVLQDYLDGVVEKIKKG